jgi:hypothetical protein
MSISRPPARFLPDGWTLRRTPRANERRRRRGTGLRRSLSATQPAREPAVAVRKAARLLFEAYALAAPGARPGLILFVQTLGDLANFNPHVHVLATDGAFLADGSFVALPPVPEALLERRFQHAVLALLSDAGAISQALRSKLLGWLHSGSSVHNQVRVDEHDAEGRSQLARYMLRAPLSLEKMTYDAATGTVIYRSKMHAGLKRNFQLMPGAESLELLCRPIPDRYEHLVRYVGCYSNRARGERAKRAAPEHAAEAPAAPSEPMREFAAPAKAAWARLIRKVYEADPLECPKCQGPMRVVALIDDPPVVRRILEHLGRWAPLPTERGPPEPAPDWPPGAVIPLADHPVPDIA